MALIELKSNLSKKIGKTNTTENGTFRVEQGDNTERTTQFSTDDVKLQYKKLRPDDDQFIKKDIGKTPYLVILHFLYMFVINKKISSFMKYSNDSYKKDVYYRLLKNGKYNWRKLLLLTSIKLISKLHRLQKTMDTKVLIIDDTVEIKRGKFIEGSCKNHWSNKEKRTVKGLNIVSLNYSDAHTDMMLDFSVNYNKNQIININHQITINITS